MATPPSPEKYQVSSLDSHMVSSIHLASYVSVCFSFLQKLTLCLFLPFPPFSSSLLARSTRKTTTTNLAATLQGNRRPSWPFRCRTCRHGWVRRNPQKGRLGEAIASNLEAAAACATCGRPSGEHMFSSSRNRVRSRRWRRELGRATRVGRTWNGWVFERMTSTPGT